MIELAILDPHPVVRAGFRGLFAGHTDIKLVHEPTSVSQALKLVESTSKPDILVLDLPVSGQAGFDDLASLHAAAPTVNMLVFTARSAEHYALESLRQGARSYLNKSSELSEIVIAVHKLFMGYRYFSAEVTDLLSRQISHVGGGAAHEQLSERELQVFYKLAKGETTGNIAAGLALSVKTVSTYRIRLMGKLNLSTNSDLTYYAFNNGLIT